VALTWWEAVVLAVIQGTTEWLPISSSGHLVLANELLGIEGSVGYLLLLHAGTLAAVVWVYRARLWAMLRSVATMPGDARKVGWRIAWAAHDDRRLAGWVVLGTVPIVIAGVAFRSAIERSHEGLGTLWFDFLLTAVLLARASLVRGARRPIRDLRALDAVVIGCYQALALLPAVSRSGSTLAGAVERRFGWADAADYAFLLSIPALAGAMALEWRSFGELGDAGVLASVLGFVVSGLVGYATIRFLLAFLRRTRPWPFAVYCAAVGLALAAVRFL
jgi:undecaprenyl-diphosphatase